FPWLGSYFKFFHVTAPYILWLNISRLHSRPNAITFYQTIRIVLKLGKGKYLLPKFFEQTIEKLSTACQATQGSIAIFIGRRPLKMKESAKLINNIWHAFHFPYSEKSRMDLFRALLIYKH
ncbi:MAG: hypothetical protein HW411_1265, partial [Gammaproteobacteria bacterium]|nr:hypothetical protein [Gammaproteobacteria bacterium]